MVRLTIISNTLNRVMTAEDRAMMITRNTNVEDNRVIQKVFILALAYISIKAKVIPLRNK